MTMTPGATAQIAKLIVNSKGERVAAHALCDGATIMIGSGANCGIQLDDSAISSIHCILRFADGELLVQDWCSNLGTYVNDIRIEDETSLTDGCRVRIGHYEVQVERDKTAGVSATALNSPSLDVEPEQPAQGESETSADEIPQQAAVSDAVLAREVEVPPVLDRAEPSADPDVAPSELPRVDGELSEVLGEVIAEFRTSASPPADQFESQRSQDHVAIAAPPQPAKPRRPLVESADAETVKLLQAEIECLQTELLDRDRQLAELQELAVDNAEPLQVANEDTEELVGRLEQMLDELELSDQRMRVLEDLLQNEQDVTRAQEEEKLQIEGWLGEIERRMAARETEWEGEKEALMARIEHVRAERDELDRRLEDSGHGGEGAVAMVQEGVVTELRARIDGLQESLALAEKQLKTTRLALAEARSTDPEAAMKDLIEEALREERLKLAQEHAALSRERAALSKKLAEMDPSSPNERISDADQRFRAFRETLKELHSEDKVSSPGVRKSSLGSRIADLWRRLDGPTDTD